ncbi:GRAM domain-containing protein 2B-like isoform X3 [Heterodontus francisci]|uniref:GRAM domain-containing protein 2B-like isoform X3 n=1 Tax=Heterodontus francisci TaxID=7792 RepID=UPI00355B8AB0
MYEMSDSSKYSLRVSFWKRHQNKSNCPNEIGPMAEKQKKSKKKLQAKESSLETDSILPEIQQGEGASQLTRSQASDLPGLKNEDEPNIRRKQSSSVSIAKSNATFHKQFKDINENVIDSFKCALHKEVPYYGKMYVSESYICFYSSILKETKLVVPVTAVSLLKKQNTALLVPNALCIKTTEGEKHLFASLRSRDVTFNVLKTVCAHLEELNLTSQDLDIANCHQATPEPIPSTDAADATKNETLCKENKEQEGQPEGGTSRYSGDSWFQKVTERMRSLVAFHESTTFNTLIIIYVLLVILLLISSSYIGFRIVALEEQLLSMGAWPELHTDNQRGSKGVAVQAAGLKLGAGYQD